MDQSLRSEVARRSRGRCEAFIEISGYPSRCHRQATEIHHLLTKGRGGRALDRVGEIYHLIHLCHECHLTSDGADAYKHGMLLEGDVIWDSFLSKPVYRGPDEYLKGKYGAK